MARIRSLLGDIEGSAGQITFTKQNGVNILRQKVGPNSSNTPAQQNTRSRFKRLAELFRALSIPVRKGLKPQGGVSAYNRFVQQNFANTQADALGVASVDYAKLVLSGGSVEPLARVTAALDAVAGKVTVSFFDNSNGNVALDTDGVKALVVNKATGRVVSAADEDATRADGSIDIEDDALLGVPAADLMVLAFAYRADGSDASSTSQAQVA
ncbi:DUF6266 family protein [Hymenobacter psychrophilus]|uniref:Uncharacterized protein n=1 Tax=Hymenobacter psychrophilus TaxID=651662 RepID=A0A1H3KYF7_9BACT|nr:DUF6266 family protein [Hymenobacter psychrophilus]SDY57181.1 hypothetical protein SAMN04488069_11023 [Hymenobacter psychrophilus]